MAQLALILFILFIMLQPPVMASPFSYPSQSVDQRPCRSPVSAAAVFANPQTYSPSLGICALFAWAAATFSLPESTAIRQKDMSQKGHFKRAHWRQRHVSRCSWLCCREVSGLVGLWTWMLFLLLIFTPSLARALDAMGSVLEHEKYYISLKDDQYIKGNEAPDVSFPSKDYTVQEDDQSITDGQLPRAIEKNPDLERFTIPVELEQQSELHGAAKVPCFPETQLRFAMYKPDETRSFPSPRSHATKNYGHVMPNIVINPPVLDWGPQPLFSPSIMVLNVVNTCNETWARVFHPYSTAIQFYAVGFQSSLLGPGEKVSLNIVFLPRSFGASDGVIIVQTNVGGFLVEAHGKGISSPYRLKPLSGLHTGVGKILQQSVHLYNPFDKQLEVREVYAWPADSENRTVCLSNVDGMGSDCFQDANANSSWCTEKSLRLCSCALLESKTCNHLSNADKNASIHLKAIESWSIIPHYSSEVVDFHMVTPNEGKWSGFICIRLFLYALDSEEIIILPLDVHIQKGGHIPPILPLPEILDIGLFTKKGQQKKKPIILHNTGQQPIQINNIYKNSVDRNLAIVWYRKGHIVPSGTEAQIGTIFYKAYEETFPTRASNSQKKLIIQTNSTANPDVEVLYDAVVLHNSVECELQTMKMDRDGVIEEDDSSRVYFGDGISIKFSSFKELENRIFTEMDRGNGIIISGPISLVGDEDAFQLHFTQSKSSVLLASKLQYSTVQVGSHKMEWVDVFNPSEDTILMQLMLSPTIETTDCRVNLEHRFHHVSSIREDAQSVFFTPSNAITEVVVPPHSRASLGPVIFSPREQCICTGLSVVKSNSSIVQLMPLLGRGGIAALSFLDGAVQVQEFKLDLDMTRHASLFPLEDRGDLSSACRNKFSRNFWAKNTGDMALEIYGLELSTGGCSASGLQIDSCHGFSLEAGKAAVLKFSYQPEFLAGTVNWDIELSTSIGLVRIPVVANLPNYMLSLCGDARAGSKYTNFMNLMFCISCILVLVVLFFRLFNQGEVFDSEVWNSSKYSKQRRQSSSILPSGHMPPKMDGKQKTFGTPMKPDGSKEIASRTPMDENVPAHSPVDPQTIGSSEPNLSKIRVKMVQDSSSLITDSSHSLENLSENRCAEIDENSGNEVLHSLTHSPACSSNVVGRHSDKAHKSSVSSISPKSSPNSSPRKDTLLEPSGSSSSSKFQVEKEKSKRKKKRNGVSKIKQDPALKGKSGGSSPASSPASPATPVSPQRPVSPLLFDSGGKVLASSTNSTLRSIPNHPVPLHPLSRLDVEVSQRMTLGHHAGCTDRDSGFKSPKHDQIAGDAADVQKWADTHKISDDRASVAKKPFEGSQEKNCATRVGKKRHHGPMLTASASFPCCKLRGQSFQLENDVSSPSLLNSSQIAPSARAPGTKILKNELSLEYNSYAPQLNNLVSCQSVGRGSCGSSGRNGREESGNPGSDSDKLLYDIWGDHFGEISRQSQNQGLTSPRLRLDNATCNNNSLFSSPEFSLLRQDLASPEGLTSSLQSSEFSMFSFTPDVAYAMAGTRNSDTGETPSRHYLELPQYGVPYSMHIHLPETVILNHNG